jgi:single-strand DNA-binding protein
MSSVNKVTLLGNLGADPEVKAFSNGNSVCNLRVATSQKWKDKQSGEDRERTEWHSVSIFAEGLVGIAEKYLRKGSKVYLEGQLETRKWQDRDGNDRYSTEVVLRPYNSALVLLTPQSDEDRGRHRDPSPGAGASGGERTHSSKKSPPAGADPWDGGDEIPF